MLLMNRYVRVKSVTAHRALVAVTAIVFVCICGSIGLVLLQTRRELNVHEAKQVEYRQLLVEKHANYQVRHTYLKKALTDADFFDHVVRERLGYSREDEIIFRFPDQ